MVSQVPSVKTCNRYTLINAKLKPEHEARYYARLCGFIGYKTKNSHFFEAVMVASCNEHLSLPPTKTKQKLRLLAVLSVVLQVVKVAHRSSANELSTAFVIAIIVMSSSPPPPQKKGTKREKSRLT